MKKLLSMIIIFAFSFYAAYSQDEIPNLNNVRIVTTHVAGNIYMLEATGDVAGNIAVSAGPDGILLVDTQFAQLAELIQAALKKITNENIKFIINTHHHTDHSHGNAALGKSATIIAHSNARKRMPKQARPVITFDKQMSIYFNGEEIKIIHYPPGHTDNDVVISFTKSNVVHLGDLWNSGISSFPTIDLEAGGSVKGMLKNIENLIQVIPEDAKIIPGHYALSDLEDLKSTRDMLAETIRIVDRKKSAGAGLEQIKKEGFPARYDSWGTAYTNAATWIENIYLGLAKEGSTSGNAIRESHNECPKFAISFSSSVRDMATSGRLLLLLSRTEKFITDVNANGTPVFGINVDDLKPDEQTIIDETALGNPVRSLKQIPAGDYYVKAYLNIYTTFHRSDGHIVKLHMDQGEGQKWHYSPGNLFSKIQKIHFDPDKDNTISIIMDQKIPRLPEPQDTEWVKNIKIKSELVSKFWGRPMTIGARILLPKGFHEHPEARYPVVYQHDHFSTRNPGGFRPPEGDKKGNAFYEVWNSDDFPRMLLVTFQHATPYYDDSYAINSENVGPYGDAFIQEVIPVVEKKFRAIGKPYSRVLTGGSTGGWESLAQLVWYPDFYGGTWTFCPDQIDFHYYELVNLYEPKNAYYIEHEWTKVAIPASRQTDGMPRFRMDQENWKEKVEGTRYRSGGQWAIWNAVFAPVAEDGYPKPIWDPWTGVIDPEIAQWAIEHYDITYYLKKKWETVGPKLVGKINIFCGRMDNWWIEQAVYPFEEFLASTKNPHYSGRFEYGVVGGHGWNPWREKGDVGGMYREMEEHIKRNAPSGEDTTLWNY